MSKINKVKVNDVSYDIEDLSIGDLANLSTTDKTNIVNAINEVFSGLGSAGGGNAIPTYSGVNLRTLDTGFYHYTGPTQLVTFATSGTAKTYFSKDAMFLWVKNQMLIYMYGNTTNDKVDFYIVCINNAKGTATSLDTKTIATKSYVTTYYKSLTGYDAAATQVLKNINGTLTWVTE